MQREVAVLPRDLIERFVSIGRASYDVMDEGELASNSSLSLRP